MWGAQEVEGPAAGWSVRALTLDLMSACGMKSTRSLDPSPKTTQLVVDDSEADSRTLEAARRCAAQVTRI